MDKDKIKEMLKFISYEIEETAREVFYIIATEDEKTGNPVFVTGDSFFESDILEAYRFKTLDDVKRHLTHNQYTNVTVFPVTACYHLGKDVDKRWLDV